MPTLYLGRGNDEFIRTRPADDFSNGSSLFGGNGDDTIRLGDGAPGPHGFRFGYLFISGGNGDDSVVLFGHHSLILGDNGEDRLTADGTDNWVYGGRGDDILAVTLNVGNSGNHAFGGPGDDQLFGSTPPVSGLLANNTLSGGPGTDSFHFTSPNNFSFVHVEGKSGGSVEAGDTIIGNFNLITDYEAGEALFLMATTAVTGDVGLDAGGAPLLPDGAYTVLRGDFAQASVTRFMVDPDGSDLLLVFDQDNGMDSTYHGSVVLLGVTAAEELLIA